MGKWLERYAGSWRFWILIVACTYLGYNIFFAVEGMRDSIGMLSNSYIYTSLSHGPWWWMVLFYGSEGVTGSIGIISRAIAGVFAVAAAYLFWRKKDNSPALRTATGWALLWEAIFFLAFIGSIVTAIAYNSTSLDLFYFGHTPGILIIYGTLIPLVAMVLVVTPFLLKLRAAIRNMKPHEEIVKWACLTGVGYLFAVFWFNYSMLWAGESVPYTRVYEEWGLSFVLQPANFVSFLLTVFGLLALAVFTLATTLPQIKKQLTPPNLTRIGIAMVALGGYFIFSLFYYYLTGTYSAHPSVWYEVIGPLHNPNLSVLALILLGVPLIAYGRLNRENKAKQPQ